MMTAKEINDKLKALYTKHLCKIPKDEIEKDFGTDDYSNPLLIHCWDDYTKDYIRILYIGRETNSWYSTNPTDRILYNENGYFDIDQLTNLVVKFDFEYKSQFFYLLHKINKELNGINCKCGKRPIIHNFIWTNVFKFGRKAKKKVVRS